MIRIEAVSGGVELYSPSVLRLPPLRRRRPNRENTPSYVAVFGLIAASVACQAYDPNLIDNAYDFSVDSAVPAIEVDTEQNQYDICGDGLITGGELCDTGIPTGIPGSCPTTCPSTDPCFVAELRGSGCYATCSHVAFSCRDGDDCCPPGCEDTDDSDCAAVCGDGIVESHKGEICEPASAATDALSIDPEFICPTECQDDGDPCTTERLVGNPSTCNSRCIRTRIVTPIHGDMCCPKGADSNQDIDCTPVCGNGIQECGEQCDSSENCDSMCNLVLSTDQKCVESISSILVVPNTHLFHSLIEVFCKILPTR